MGGQNGGQPSAEQRAEPTTVQTGQQNKAMPIRQVEHQVVSSLSQPMSCLLYTSMEGSSEIGIRIKGLIEIRLKKSEKEFVVPDNIEEFDIRNYV